MELTLFLCGDVMTGRGIDQILPHPGDPRLAEPSVDSAEDYRILAETAHGPIPAPVSFAYIWGDALAELDRIKPDARIINLETSITTSSWFWPKGINYRMNPANVGCITAAGIDCCSLANNHVLDFGAKGLEETITVLERAHIGIAGAGQDLAEAQAPWIKDISGRGRVIVFGFAHASSGIPGDWAAEKDKSGIDLLTDLSAQTVESIGQRVHRIRKPDDVVVASIHWGGNWGYDVPIEHREFAHALIENAGIDIVHGHSSHHPKPIEVHQGKLILYGCGDFLNDYEGISGYEEYRSDLTLMYLPTVDSSSGRLVSLTLIAFLTRKFRLERASAVGAIWVRDRLNREQRSLGYPIELSPENTLKLKLPSTAGATCTHSGPRGKAQGNCGQESWVRSLPGEI